MLNSRHHSKTGRASLLAAIAVENVRCIQMEPLDKKVCVKQLSNKQLLLTRLNHLNMALIYNIIYKICQYDF